MWLSKAGKINLNFIFYHMKRKKNVYKYNKMIQNVYKYNKNVFDRKWQILINYYYKPKFRNEIETK